MQAMVVRARVVQLALVAARYQYVGHPRAGVLVFCAYKWLNGTHQILVCGPSKGLLVACTYSSWRWALMVLAVSTISPIATFTLWRTQQTLVHMQVQHQRQQQYASGSMAKANSWQWAFNGFGTIHYLIYRYFHYDGLSRLLDICRSSIRGSSNMHNYLSVYTHL